MFTGGGIEAGVGDLQPLHRFAVEDVRLDDLVDIGQGDMSVPNGFWIDDDGRPVLALIEASGFVGADGGAD